MKSEVPITKKETKSERKLRISVTKQRVLRWHEKRIQEKRRTSDQNQDSVESTQEIPQAERVLSLTTPSTDLFRTLGLDTDLEELISHRTTLRINSQNVISALQDERLLLV